MKILHVINTLKTGGAEKLVSEIVPRLIKLGNKVDVFVFDGTTSYFKQLLINAGVNIISYKSGCNPYNPLVIFKLVNLLNQYDIVHSHNTSPQLFVAVANLFCKPILITTEHSTSNRRRNKRGFRVIDKFMYNRYSKVICISNSTKEMLSEYIPSIQNRLMTIYNGINTVRYSLAPRLSDDEKKTTKFVVTMVARFSYQKDHITVLKALSHLDKSQFELWLVGDGDRRGLIEYTIKNLGLSDNVRLWGQQNDVRSIIQSSDVIIQISHIEGFGLAAVEGMAAGKPVVATDIPGLSEVISGAGVLVEPQDDIELAEALKLLKNNPEFYMTTAQSCATRAKLFDIDVMAKKYNDLYESVIMKTILP